MRSTLPALAGLAALLLSATAPAQLGTPGPAPYPLSPSSATPVGLQNDLTGNLLHTGIGADEIMNMTTAAVLNPGWPVLTPNSQNAIGVATDGTNIYVTDTALYDIDRYDLAGNYVASVGIGHFSAFPEGITWNPLNGHFYVVDGAGGNRVGEFDANLNLLTTYPILGTSPDGIQHDSVFGGFWLYTSGDATVRHYDYCFNVVESFTAIGGGEGVATVGTTLFLVIPATREIRDFDISAATNVPFVPCAMSSQYGVGCLTSNIQESWGQGAFDLANSSVTFLANGNGGWTAVNPGLTGYINPVAPTVIASTDENVVPVALPGAGFTHPGGTSLSVGVGSNGYLWLDATTTSDWTPTTIDLARQGPRIAALWSDLNPGAGGQVSHEPDPGNPSGYIINWQAVPEFGNAGNLNTVQVQLDLSTGSFTLAWQGVALTANPAVVGYSEGGLVNPPPDVDLSVAGIGTGNGGQSLVLATVAGSRPTQPSTFMMQVSNFTAPTPVFEVFSFTRLLPGVSLDPFGITGCRQYVNLDSVTFVLAGADPLAWNLNIPAAPSFAGIELGAQAIVVSPGANPLGFRTSNGLRIRLGN